MNGVAPERRSTLGISSRTRSRALAPGGVSGQPVDQADASLNCPGLLAAAPDAVVPTRIPPDRANANDNNRPPEAEAAGGWPKCLDHVRTEPSAGLLC